MAAIDIAILRERLAQDERDHVCRSHLLGWMYEQADFEAREIAHQEAALHRLYESAVQASPDQRDAIREAFDDLLGQWWRDQADLIHDDERGK